MIDTILHNQYANVFYSREEPVESKNKGYKKYRHISVYIPSNVQLDRYVYCKSEKDHSALVNDWNRISVLQSPVKWIYYIP